MKPMSKASAAGLLEGLAIRARENKKLFGEVEGVASFPVVNVEYEFSRVISASVVNRVRFSMSGVSYSKKELIELLSKMYWMEGELK